MSFVKTWKFVVYLAKNNIIHRHHPSHEWGKQEQVPHDRRSDTIEWRSDPNTRASLSLPPQALSSAGARWEIRKIYLWECRGGKRRREEKNGKGNVTEEIIRRSMKCSHLRLRMHNKRLMRPNEVYFHAVETQHRVARHNRAIVIINSTHLALCTSVEVHSLSLAAFMDDGWRQWVEMWAN